MSECPELTDAELNELGDTPTMAQELAMLKRHRYRQKLIEKWSNILGQDFVDKVTSSEEPDVSVMRAHVYIGPRLFPL